MPDENVSTPREMWDRIESDLYPAVKIHATGTWSTRRKALMADELERLTSEARRARAYMREAGHTDDACAWREIEVFLEAMEAELRMWLAVAEGNATLAWDHLVDAQQWAEYIAGRRPEYKPAAALASHLDEVERIVFPRQLFVSPGMIVSGFHCSICNAVYGECEHLAGEIYNGEIAYQVADKIERGREVSIVSDPASKRHRALSLGGYDALTGEHEKDTADE